MTRLRTYVLLLAVVFLAAPAATAQDIAVQASVDATTVGTEETVTYTIEVEGVRLSRIETPSPPDTDGLVLLQSSPVTRTDISYTNGEVQSTATFRWTYRPIREGTARLQPATVIVAGETYRTEAIELRVEPQAQRSGRSPAPSGRQPGSSGISSLAEDSESSVASDLFIRAEAIEEEAYVGEQVPLTYRLYYREGLRLRGTRLAGSWDAAGFWREEMDVPSRPAPRTSTMEGERYRTIVLKRVAVFPARAGSLQVAPLRVETDVQRPSGRSPMSRFFSGSGPSKRVEITSDPVMLHVKPLPDGAPVSFEGAVGAFQMDVQLNRAEVEVGESVEIEVRLSGKGNLSTLDPPPLELPPAFDQFDPDVNASINRGGTYVRGTKTFTYTLVPEEAGVYTLSPIEFSYFDPEDERYETLQENLPPIRVRETEETPVATGTTGEGMPVGDIAGLITNASNWTRTDATPLHRSPWAYAALLLPMLLLGGLLAYRRLQEAPDTPRTRRQQAQAVARRHLERARQLHERNEPRPFYEEIERAVLGFIDRRLRMATQGLTRPQLDARLEAAGVPTDTRQTLFDLLDECDRARFAPVDPDATAFRTAHERTSALLADLYRHLE